MLIAFEQLHPRNQSRYVFPITTIGGAVVPDVDSKIGHLYWLFTVQELKSVLQKLQKNISPVSDGVTNLALKNLPVEALEWLLGGFNVIWISCEITVVRILRLRRYFEDRTFTV